MLEAVLRKEWKQMRTLRWIGVALAVVLPLVLVAAAEASRQGWMPTGQIAGYSAAAVVRDSIPWLAMLLWPLLAVMFAAQALAADRAAGTEAFLLERPVPRRTVWSARLAAAASSTAVVMLAQALIWTLMVLASGGGAWIRITHDELVSPVLVAVGLALLGLLAGAAAGAFLRSPLQAVMLGAVLTAMPPAVAGFLSGRFPAVQFRGVHLGWAFTLLLAVALPLASFAMCCRGEPAGRGRLRRGATPLAVALVLVFAAFGVSAPFALRADARYRLANSVLDSARGGGGLVATSHSGSGWLVDTEAGRPVRFLPSQIFQVAWNADGSRVAVMHSAKPMGGWSASPRIQVFGLDGTSLGEPIACRDCSPYWFAPMRWAGSELLLGVRDDGDGALTLLEPETGRRRVIERGLPDRKWTVLGPTDSGELFLYRREDAPSSPGGRADGPGTLRRIDVGSATLDARVMRADLGESPGTWLASFALSPSGRYWLEYPSDSGKPFRLFDLTRGEELEAPQGRAAWLSGDRLVWQESAEDRTDLFLGTPGQRRSIRSWKGAKRRANLVPSTDRSRLFFGLWKNHGDQAVLKFSEVYDPSTDSWTDAKQLFGLEGGDAWGKVQWAGPSTLAYLDEGVLALKNVDDPGPPVYVIGRPPS